MEFGRREVIGTGLALLAGEAGLGSAKAQETAPSDSAGYGAANTGQAITSSFARFLSAIQYGDLPPAAVHEGKRAVLDWIGCALAGSTHPTVGILLASFEDIGSMPVATVIGQRGRKLSLLDASVANGQMGHVLDFDDTHLGGVILHTSTASLPALLALGERRKSSGRDLIAALAAAFEAGIRVGQAAPSHHLAGWHLTGTLGTVAAAAGAARLAGLNEQQMIYALGIACTQAGGMQQNRGSDCKSLHAGKSAYHGVMAATLSSHGFNSSPEILEGALGFTKIFSATQQNGAILAGLGQSWKIAGNGYKPYACGVVLHPLIDAMIEVAKKSAVPAAELEGVEVRVHPDVIRITGVDQPGSGLMSKFSANHAAAVAFIDKAAGVAQFTNQRVADAGVQALRRRVQIRPMAAFRLDQSSATVRTKSGRAFVADIAHATGTEANPMPDSALVTKFLANAEPVIGPARARALSDMIWKLESLGDIGDIVRAAV